MTMIARALRQTILAMAALAVVSAGGCGWIQVPGSGINPTTAGQPASPPVLASAPVVPRPPVAERASAPAIRVSPGGSAVQVAPGDTVYALSRRHGAPVEKIIEANNLRPPYHLAVGQWVTLPGDGQAPRVPAATGQPSQASESSTPTPLVARAPLPPPAVPPPPAASAGGFMWPVDGKVVSGFGRKTKGFRNDGINIEVARGTPVRASQSGVVAYAGNELRGFGNMLLIKHSGGWVTAYAHNETLLAGRGDKVRKGQIVAKVGTSGSVTKPQLHFELRKGKKPVNPLRYLGKGAV